MVELVPTYQWPRFDLRFIATGFVVPSLKFAEKNKESSKISCAEKDMKNLPTPTITDIQKIIM